MPSVDSHAGSDPVEFPIEGAQENDSLREAEPEAVESRKSDELEEVEVTPDADIRIRGANTEPENESRSEDAYDEASTVPEQVAVSQEGAEVEMEAAETFEGAEQTEDGEKAEPELDFEQKQSTIIDEEIKLDVVDAVVQEEESNSAPVPGSHEEEKLVIQEEDFKMYERGEEDTKRSPFANNYEAAAKQDEQEAQDSTSEPSAPEDTATKTQEMPSKQSDAAQPEGVNKKTKRKRQSGRKAKKSLEADAETIRGDTAGIAAAAV